MKKSSKLKSVLILIISMATVLAFSNFVYATDIDDNPFTLLQPTSTQSTSQDLLQSGTQDDTQSSSQTGTSTSNDDFTPLTADSTKSTSSESDNLGDLLPKDTNNNNKQDNTNNNTNNNVNNTNVNRNVSNTNNLADTGLEDVNGIFALVVVLCGISAIYSYKKISDYKKI